MKRQYTNGYRPCPRCNQPLYKREFHGKTVWQHIESPEHQVAKHLYADALRRHFTNSKVSVEEYHGWINGRRPDVLLKGGLSHVNGIGVEIEKGNRGKDRQRVIQDYHEAGYTVQFVTADEIIPSWRSVIRRVDAPVYKPRHV